MPGLGGGYEPDRVCLYCDMAEAPPNPLSAAALRKGESRTIVGK
jgi:hypothetical protein